MDPLQDAKLSGHLRSLIPWALWLYVTCNHAYSDTLYALVPAQTGRGAVSSCMISSWSLFLEWKTQKKKELICAAGNLPLELWLVCVC